LLLATHSIIGMFRAIPSPWSRQAFILAILNQLRSRQLALAEGLDRLFGVDVLSAHEALDIIRGWMRGPLFLP
jgi:hypothetical protein